KLKVSAQRAGQNLLLRLNSVLKKLTVRLLPNSNLPGNSLLTEYTLTFRLYPIALLAVIGFAITAIVIPASVILPATFAVLVLLLSDLSTRETRSNTMAFIFSAPRLKENFVWWKFVTALMITLTFTIVPMMRNPHSAFAIATGSIFVAAAATAFGS